MNSAIVCCCRYAWRLWASMRNRGQSIGSIAGTVMGTRVRSLMMIVIFL